MCLLTDRVKMLNINRYLNQKVILFNVAYKSTKKNFKGKGQIAPYVTDLYDISLMTYLRNEIINRFL